MAHGSLQGYLIGRIFAVVLIWSGVPWIFAGVLIGFGGLAGALIRFGGPWVIVSSGRLGRRKKNFLAIGTLTRVRHQKAKWQHTTLRAPTDLGAANPHNSFKKGYFKKGYIVMNPRIGARLAWAT